MITACLAQALRERGHLVRAIKPLASGVEPGTPGDDATLIAAGAGHAPLVHTTLQAPVSPHRALRLEDRHVEPEILAAWIDRHSAGVTLVEGAGGWHVPLIWPDGGSPWGVPELARHVNGPVVVVAADRLGCLSHTVLTVRAVRTHGLTVAGVALNRRERLLDDASRPWNLHDLRGLIEVPIVAVPFIDPHDPADRGRVGARLLDELALPTTPIRPA